AYPNWRSVGLQLELSFVPLYEGGMLADEAISMAYDAGFHLEVIEQGWAARTGQMLQADGIFFRD
ncbi:MAG: gsc-like protein, partial [Microbacterium sp.]